jgi:hypothetical protein
MAVSQKSDRRLQFDISETMLEEFVALMHECDLNTKKELLDNAITAFQWMTEQIRDGRIILSVDESTRDDPITFWMPALRVVAQKSKRLKKKTR